MAFPESVISGRVRQKKRWQVDRRFCGQALRRAMLFRKGRRGKYEWKNAVRGKGWSYAGLVVSWLFLSVDAHSQSLAIWREDGRQGGRERVVDLWRAHAHASHGHVCAGRFTVAQRHRAMVPFNY